MCKESIDWYQRSTYAIFISSLSLDFSPLSVISFISSIPSPFFLREFVSEIMVHLKSNFDEYRPTEELIQLRLVDKVPHLRSISPAFFSRFQIAPSLLVDVLVWGGGEVDWTVKWLGKFWRTIGNTIEGVAWKVSRRF